MQKQDIGQCEIGVKVTDEIIVYQNGSFVIINLV